MMHSSLHFFPLRLKGAGLGITPKQHWSSQLSILQTEKESLETQLKQAQARIASLEIENSTMKVRGEKLAGKYILYNNGVYRVLANLYVFYGNFNKMQPC